jgi:hypothetical protein
MIEQIAERLYRCTECGLQSRLGRAPTHHTCRGRLPAGGLQPAACRELLWNDCRQRHRPDAYPDYPWRPLAEIAAILDRWQAAGTITAPGCYEKRQAIVTDLLYADRWRPEWGSQALPSGSQGP